MGSWNTSTPYGKKALVQVTVTGPVSMVSSTPMTAWCQSPQSQRAGSVEKLWMSQ